ncbi:MAG: Flp pilus assembly complex ATPase component TadA [Candidatus Thermoplasmatota archaeon]|nr:Flp pilus assembly complex ATPase component TadA [Candidatus Thermoplasmatota archaeon]
MGLRDQAKQTTEIKVKETSKEKLVICGKCGAFISPFAEICPSCGSRFEEKIIEEEGRMKKIPIRIVATEMEGEKFEIPEVKKVKGKQMITSPEEFEHAMSRVKEVPVSVEEEKEGYIMPGKRRVKVEEKRIEVPEIPKEEIPKPAKPKERMGLRDFSRHEMELIKAAEKEKESSGTKAAETFETREEGVKEAKLEEWETVKETETREAKPEEIKIEMPEEFKPFEESEIKIPEEFETVSEEITPEEVVPKPEKKGVFSAFRKKRVESAGISEEEFESVEKEEYVGVEFKPLGENFEEIEVYPIIEPYAYVRILYNKKEHTRFYEVVEPSLTEKEKEMLGVIENAFIKSLGVSVEELDKEPVKHLREAMNDIIKAYSLPIPREAEDKTFYFIKRDMLGFGKIDVLTNDPNIEDISCNGPGIPLYIYHRRYESMETNIVYEDAASLESYVIRLAQRCGKHISTSTPLIDSTLMDGSRIVMTLGKEVSTKGSTFTIRKFREDPLTPTDLVTFKTVSPLMLAYIWLAVQYGMSMLFVGGTASGKTTTLNAISLFISPQMKIVSIEETRELNLPHPNWIPGCTREGFGGEAVGGKLVGEVNMYDLLKASLRERPEYIIVGEIRGSEAYVLFQAMATGHTTFSTMHADSVPGLIHRLENKPVDIPRVMIPSLDAVCIQIQTRVGGRRVRRMKQIVEIIGLDPHSKELLTNEVFRWAPALDDFEFSGKSYVLEKIMIKANIRKDEVMNELKRRQAILEWMVSKGVRKHADVARIIAEYQTRPQEVLERVKEEMGEKGMM